MRKQMRNAVLFLSFILLSSNAFALDGAVENAKALCNVLVKGEHLETQGKGQVQADGSIKIVGIDGKVELSFTKSEWDGVKGNYNECLRIVLIDYEKKTTSPNNERHNGSKHSIKTDKGNNISFVPRGDKNKNDGQPECMTKVVWNGSEWERQIMLYNGAAELSKTHGAVRFLDDFKLPEYKGEKQWKSEAGGDRFKCDELSNYKSK
jgi:hypothetical protein